MNIRANRPASSARRETSKGMFFSARPMSRTSRVRRAISRADSIRQTASTAVRVSVAVTATDHAISGPSVRAQAGRAYFFA